MRAGLVVIAFSLLAGAAAADETPSKVREVAYQGAGRFELAELEGASQVRPGRPLDLNANRLACGAIEDYLKDQGYHFAVVSLLEGDNEKDTRVVFDIDAGPQVRIGAIRFTGFGDWTSADKLAELIQTKQAFFRSWGEPFRPEALDRDAEILRRHCRDNGFLDADVDYELTWRDGCQYVDVAFRVQEGERYRIAGWHINRTGKLPRRELNRLIQLKKGDFYSVDDIHAATRRLYDWGGRQGKNMKVRDVCERDPERPGMVRVHFEVKDAPVDYVGEIIIVGNTVTKDEVIRRQITLMPGQILDYSQVRVIEENLRKLGIFEVNPESDERQGASMPEYDRAEAMFGRSPGRPRVMVLQREGKYRDIVVRVEETRTGSMTVGFGFDLLLNPGFLIVVEERNFDPERWPTSCADFFDGTAFRGGGQHVRFEFGSTSLVSWGLDWLSPFLP